VPDVGARPGGVGDRIERSAPLRRVSTYALLIVLSAALLTAQGGPPPDEAKPDPVAEALAAARKALDAKDAAGAEALLKPLVNAEPPVPMAMSLLAKARELAGDATGAEQMHLAALHAGPEVVEVCQNAMDFYARNGLLTNGVQAFGGVRDALKDLPVQRMMFAHLLRAAGLADQAQEEFAAIGALAEGDLTRYDSALLLTIGAASLEAGNPAQAVGVLKKVVDDAPDEAAHQFWYGKALIRAGNTAEGTQYVLRAIATAPGDVSFAVETAEILLATAVPQAEAAVNHLIELRPDLQGFRVRLVKQLGRTGDAEALTRQRALLAELATTDAWRQLIPEDKLYVGAACVETGKPADGVPVLEAVVAEWPGTPAHYVWLARAYRDSGRPEDALGTLATGAKGAPDDAGIVQETATLLSSLGRDREASKAVQGFLDRTERIDGITIGLGGQLLELLRRTGEQADARAWERRLATQLAEVPWQNYDAAAQFQVGVACLKVGNADLAARVLRSAADAAPTAAAHYAWLAKAYQALGKTNEMLDALADALRTGSEDTDLVAQALDPIRRAGGADVPDLTPLLIPRDRPQTAEAAHLLEGLSLTLCGREDEAARVLQPLMGEAKSPEVQYTAAKTLAALSRAKGDSVAADAAQAMVAELSPKVRAVRAQSADRPQYYANKWELQGQALERFADLKRQAEEQAQAGKAADAIRLYEECFSAYPDLPGARDVALAVGNLLKDAGDAEGALGYYAAALDPGEDRCFATDTVHSEHQPFLDEVAVAPRRSRIDDAFAGINACTKAIAGYDQLDRARLSSFVDAWYAALSESYTPWSDSGAAKWEALAAAEGASPWHELALWGSACAHIRLGHYTEALTACERAKAERVKDRAMEQRLAHARRMALLGQCRLAEAKAALGQASGSDGTMAPHVRASLCLSIGRAGEMLGRCAEQAGDWAAADTAYEALRTTPVDSVKRLAAEGRMRVAELQASTSALGEKVACLPDDRTTRGDWPIGYGGQYYVLCAQNFIADRAGGPGDEVPFHLATTDPSESGRRWVTRVGDADPAALWDPARRVRVAANWDDYGEQTPLGQGPDVVVTVQVPAGRHLLSLYFVNDHNYYEPSRRHGIIVTDGAGRLQAVSHVVDEGGGVYKRFAVTGPVALNVRIRRDAAIDTLVSGVFLDAADWFDLSEHPLFAKVPPSDGVAAYRALCAAQTAGPSPTTDLAAVTKAADALALEVVSAKVDGVPGELGRAQKWWALSECRRMQGRHREAEAAFDEFAVALSRGTTYGDALAGYDALARAVLRLSPEAAEAAVYRALGNRSVAVGEGDRLARFWSQCMLPLLARAELGEDGAKEALHAVVGASDPLIVPEARIAVAKHLREALPGLVVDGALLVSLSEAARSLGRTDDAIGLLNAALATQMTPDRTAAALYTLMTLLAKSHAAPAEIRALHTQLVALDEPRSASLVQRSWLLLARSYLDAHDYAEAESAAGKYVASYGASEDAQRILDACRQAADKAEEPAEAPEA